MEFFEVGEALGGGLETLFLSLEGLAEDLFGAALGLVLCELRLGLGMNLICWALAPLFLTLGGPLEDSMVACGGFVELGESVYGGVFSGRRAGFTEVSFVV